MSPPWMRPAGLLHALGLLPRQGQVALPLVGGGLAGVGLDRGDEVTGEQMKMLIGAGKLPASRFGRRLIRVRIADWSACTGPFPRSTTSPDDDRPNSPARAVVTSCLQIGVAANVW